MHVNATLHVPCRKPPNKKVSGKEDTNGIVEMDGKRACGQEVDTNSSSPHPPAARAPTPPRVCKKSRDGEGEGGKTMYRVVRVQRRRERFERCSSGRLQTNTDATLGQKGAAI